MRLLSCSQIGPVLLNGRESNVLGESRQTDTVRLGSLAVVEPLIIVCPDRVYLFKLFLVLRKHSPPQDIKHRNVDVLAAIPILPLLWLQLYGGEHTARQTGRRRETCMAQLGPTESDVPDTAMG